MLLLISVAMAVLRLIYLNYVPKYLPLCVNMFKYPIRQYKYRYNKKMA